MNGQLDVIFECQVEAVHKLGPRALREMLAELGAKHLIMTSIESTVERYAALDPKVVAAVGANRFPPRPLWQVPKK